MKMLEVTLSYDLVNTASILISLPFREGVCRVDRGKPNKRSCLFDSYFSRGALL